MINKPKYTLSLCLICLLVLTIGPGCSTPTYNYTPEITELSEPPLNTVVTVHVGDSMVKQGKYSEHDAIYITEDVKVGWAYTLTEGYYLRQGESNKSEYYRPAGGTDSGEIRKAAIADPFKGVSINKKTGRLCVITAFNVEVSSKHSNFERRKYPVLSSNSFQQTLIYSGKVGNKINIGYREFSSSYARPAFNNDVEYDLSESKMIGYKGCQIEVIEATNEYIKYKVIRNFNEAQF